MIKELNVHSSVQVKSAVLKEDRKDAGYTQAAFSAACRSVSLSTVRRAEQGFRVTEPALRRMSDILNMPIERYIASPKADEMADYVAWVAGDWTYAYVWAKSNYAPRVITQEITIRQSGDHIEGAIAEAKGIDIPPVRYFSGKVANSIVTGSTNLNGTTTSAGLGTFCQTAKRHDCWLDGHLSWFDPDSDQIQVSRLIGVRQGNPNYDCYFQEAMNIVERELSVNRIRKLMEAGYMLDDAVIMLAALKDVTQKTAVFESAGQTD